MAPPELIERKACCIGIRAELNVLEANPDHPGRAPEHSPPQKSKLSTMENSPENFMNMLWKRAEPKFVSEVHHGNIAESAV